MCVREHPSRVGDRGSWGRERSRLPTRYGAQSTRRSQRGTKSRVRHLTEPHRHPFLWLSLIKKGDGSKGNVMSQWGKIIHPCGLSDFNPIYCVWGDWDCHPPILHILRALTKPSGPLVSFSIWLQLSKSMFPTFPPSLLTWHHWELKPDYPDPSWDTGYLAVTLFPPGSEKPLMLKHADSLTCPSKSSSPQQMVCACLRS